jgi:hypothetical protein
MPTAEERKFELKQKRSDALMAKINVLRAKYGSSAPPIDSMKDEDDFNLGLLFGKSKNENIDWEHMGVEGVIRCYYEIIYQLTGKKRNNIIKTGLTSGSPQNDHNVSSRSGMLSAVKYLADGEAYKSGFYIGYDGLERDAAREDNATKKRRLNQMLNLGRRGELHVKMTKDWPSLASALGQPQTSTTFENNRDAYLQWNSSESRLEWVYPPDNTSGSLLGPLDQLLDIIGYKSPFGPHVRTVPFGASHPNWERYTNNTLLGYRFRDVIPEVRNNPYSTTTSGGTQTDPETGEEVDLPDVTNYYDGSNSMGDGVRDDYSSPGGRPSGYNPTPDFWTENYDSTAQTLIDRINTVIQYINYTKIQDFTYIVNHRVLPGIDMAYNPNDPDSNIGSSWDLQNTWIEKLEEIRDRLQHSLNYIAARKESSTKTLQSARLEVDTEIETIKDLIPTWVSDIQSLSSEIDGVFGDVGNPMSLYGHRYLWVRTLIHATEGSMTAINSTGIAIEMMDRKLEKADEELAMFGLIPDEYIPIPIIVGIEPYPILNQATFEMEIGGWLVAWGGQEHCTGYDVWRSLDYDPETKDGTWEKLEISNTDYTMSDVDANTGKVLTYIIDTNVDPIPNDVDPSTVTHPYYRVRAYDINGGSGEYARENSKSEVCEPLNPAAFPFGGDSIDTTGPRRTPVTLSDVGEGSSIPPNTLFWVTSFKGSEALDFERMIFESEAPFDSIASNLIVFVDGEFKNQGLEDDGGDYEKLDDVKIKFHNTIPLESEVNLVVALRSFKQNSNITGTVEYQQDLPTTAQHGDIYFVENPSPGSYWQYFDPPGEWRQIQDPSASSIWRDPVNTFSQLPTQFNADGDIRLVLDTSTLFRWDGVDEMWVKISGGSGSGWLSPVDTSDELNEIDTSNITNGAIIFVISEESLYRWSATQNQWVVLSGSSAINWREPVNSFSQLPTLGNREGDIRFVLSENKMYRWSSWDREWLATKAEADLAHGELNDSDWEVVDDHDARYYPRNDLDTYHNDIDERLELLESLKPKNAEPLSGHFGITGTKLYEGFLSISDSISRFDTLRPKDYFHRILKDGNLILNNQNTQQFKDADKGILKCYINDVEVDSFDLAEWFNEDERETGQTYPRQTGVNNIIEIMSVGPYNQYATYQRADFQLNITEDLLVAGENNIRLEHELLNDNNDIEMTENFTIFWDNFSGEMGFKSVSMQEVTLQSSSYLSGIRHYSIGDEIKIMFEAENMFKNTYVEDRQIYIDVSNFGVKPYYVNYHDVDFVGTPEPKISEDLFYIKDLEITEQGVQYVEPNLQLIARNPIKSYTHNKNNTGFLINTITQQSNNLEEFFVDEVYRLPIASYESQPTTAGQWNSQQTLSNIDLQVFGGELIYPSINYNGYWPQQTINYSNASGAKQYIRAFIHNKPHNNGVLKIEGFYLTDPNIKVDIKLPGLTGWLSLNTKYNAADFTGVDGDGCLIKNSGDVYDWTSGEFSTADCGYMALVRITMYQSTNSISYVKMDWN